MKIKRYIREFGNDIIKRIPIYEDNVKRAIRYHEKGLITDFETMQILCNLLKEEE